MLVLPHEAPSGKLGLKTQKETPQTANAEPTLRPGSSKFLGLHSEFELDLFEVLPGNP